MEKRTMTATMLLLTLLMRAAPAANNADNDWASQNGGAIISSVNLFDVNRVEIIKYFPEASYIWMKDKRLADDPDNFGEKATPRNFIVLHDDLKKKLAFVRQAKGSDSF